MKLDRRFFCEKRQTVFNDNTERSSFAKLFWEKESPRKNKSASVICPVYSMNLAPAPYTTEDGLLKNEDEESSQARYLLLSSLNGPIKAKLGDGQHLMPS